MTSSASSRPSGSPVSASRLNRGFRYYVNPDKATQSFLSLTSQGLIAVNDGSFGESAEWRFTTQAGADFNGKGVSSNLTSEAATLYRGVKEDASYNRIAVQQNMVVQKSLEQRAKEAADMIFNLRQKRVQIVTGDTDATYSGEAMGAALKEISALEKEYMSMFIGYSDFQTQKLKCDVVPVKNRKSQTYVAFRISETICPENLTFWRLSLSRSERLPARVPKQSRMWPSTGFRPSAQSVFPMA